MDNVKVKKKNIPRILSDNDAQYLSQTVKIVSFIDSTASILIVKNLKGYRIKIEVKEDKKEELIKELREFHYLINLRIEFSNSLNISKSVSYQVIGEYI